MTYHNAVKYVKNAPNSSVGDLSSERLGYICRLIDNPQKKFNYLRLAGTNGKTICSAMLSSVLDLSGYSVCALNMSLLDDPRNNIKVNCQPLDIPEFTALIQTVASLASQMQGQISSARAQMNGDNIPEEIAKIPSALLENDAQLALTRSEILLLAALIYCREKHCKICIIESSNGESDPSLFLPPPFAAVICGAIPSTDKRRIHKIKSYLQRGINEVVSAPEDTVAYKAISDTCASINCRLSVPVRSALTLKQLSLIGSRFVYGNEEYRLSLCGRFQTTNAITVIETLKLLRRSGYGIPLSAEKEGLARVRIPSRFEVISINPTIIADSTYKDEAVETVCESLFDFSEITGRVISLCLPPEENLIKKYVEMLTARGYTISEIYTLTNDEKHCEELTEKLYGKYPLLPYPTAKALSKKIFASLEADSVLLISGSSTFTNPIRLEITRLFQF